MVQTRVFNKLHHYYFVVVFVVAIARSVFNKDNYSFDSISFPLGVNERSLSLSPPDYQHVSIDITGILPSRCRAAWEKEKSGDDDDVDDDVVVCLMRRSSVL